MIWICNSMGWVFSCKLAAYFEHLFTRTPMEGCFWNKFTAVMIILKFSFKWCSFYPLYVQRICGLKIVWKMFGLMIQVSLVRWSQSFGSKFVFVLLTVTGFCFIIPNFAGPSFHVLLVCIFYFALDYFSVPCIFICLIPCIYIYFHSFWLNLLFTMKIC